MYVVQIVHAVIVPAETIVLAAPLAVTKKKERQRLSSFLFSETICNLAFAIITINTINTEKMKPILLSILISFSFYTMEVNAQNNILPKIEGDTLFTSSGYNIVAGQKLRIGAGTMPDGNFKYIRINSASFFAYNTMSDNIHNPNEANYANSLNRRESGHEYIVAKLQKRGSTKTGYVYYILSKTFPRYEVDIENAISSGEIVIPSNLKSQLDKDKQSESRSFSIAEEINKFRNLYIQGALTGEEYELQKRRLLSQN